MRFLESRQAVTFDERPTVHDGANQAAANDNNTPAPDTSSALDLLLSSAEDANIEGLVRRTERLGVLVVVVMAIVLVFVPALLVALRLGI
ncbi:hypothetical protein MLTONO_2599 [Mesorhizobium loti]|nr:hypothetical protein MLTONO_2599 [Mesorhizobium loti]